MSVNVDTSSSKYQQYSFPSTDNATKFDPKDARNGCRLGNPRDRFYGWYERLREINEGLVGSWRDQRQVTREMNYYTIDAVASQLQLSAQQKNWTKNSMTRVNCQRYSNVGGVEIVAFCLCLISCKEDEICQNRYYHPLSNSDKNDRLFSKIFHDLEFDPQETANTIQKLRHELGLQ